MSGSARWEPSSRLGTVWSGVLVVRFDWRRLGSTQCQAGTYPRKMLFTTVTIAAVGAIGWLLGGLAAAATAAPQPGTTLAEPAVDHASNSVRRR